MTLIGASEKKQGIRVDCVIQLIEAPICVKCCIVNLTKPLVKYYIALPLFFSEHYLTLIAWQDDTWILVGWMNRPQNKAIMMLCNTASGKCHIVRIKISCPFHFKCQMIFILGISYIFCFSCDTFCHCRASLLFSLVLPY